MNISLHKCARTTPAIRAEIAASSAPASVLKQALNLVEPADELQRRGRQRALAGIHIQAAAA